MFIANDPLFFSPGDPRLQLAGAGQRAGVAGGRRSVVGRIAYDTLSELPTSDADGSPGLRCALLSGCFSESLERIARGEDRVHLHIDHDFTKVLATTEGGTLKAWEAGGFLYFRASLATAPASVAACSLIPLILEHPVHHLGTGESVKIIRSALLFELSLTDRPAMGRLHAPAWLE